MQHNDTILVTGSTGMMGSALMRRLLADGYGKVIAPTHAALELKDAQAVNAYVERHNPDYVFHLAARVGGIHANNTYPAEFIFDNTAMQLNVFETARKAGVKKILFPGSACTYPSDGQGSTPGRRCSRINDS